MANNPFRNPPFGGGFLYKGSGDTTHDNPAPLMFDGIPLVFDWYPIFFS
jgi:hypothetical protein